MGKFLTVNGRTYTINSEWTNVAGHASGLQYVNHPGVKLQMTQDPKSLPNGQPGEYIYQLDQPDASSFYFDAHGKPMQKCEPDGSYIYHYKSSGKNLGAECTRTLLDSIQHSSGESIQFAYTDDAQIAITAPSGTTTTVQFDENTVVSLEETSADRRWVFDCIPCVQDSAKHVLSRIAHPDGIGSLFDYGVIEGLNDQGRTFYLSHVSTYSVCDTDDSVQQSTKYELGRYSRGNSYTGASIGCRMNDTADELFEGSGKAPGYWYDVTQSSCDSADRETAMLTRSFNNYHLLTEVVRYRLVEGDFLEDQKTVYTYEIPSDGRAATTTYAHPVSVAHFANTASQGEPVWASRGVLSQDQIDRLEKSHMW
ncbi:hypothetical protein BO99DRAFT_59487 [Aspergillus violaceofuscus CBS 115571]|uniref:Uncharacterized protein n=1 Tax=Aspergillus violaceofuscus (strain CBS 115571) TaxID=1450538 RepID=A0A2V5I0W7_ASPV1|nr:hypothetical protein BO99DRAFT_59487 [Aspergillus violaceofuscus CBS 115571]